MRKVDPERYFCSSYQTCRQQFLARVKELRFSGLNVMTADFVLPVRGPNHEPLAIDFVKIWSHNDYTKALILSSGVHGPELFAGSAVQCQVIDDLKSGVLFLPRDTVILLIHAVNPFGAAWLRRTNVRNVDLNRNFVPDFALALSRERMHPQIVKTQNIYRQYPSLFAPKSITALDFPRLSLLSLIWKHGLQSARFAMSTGQRVFPLSLFYGGRALEPETEAVMEKVGEMLFQVGHEVTRVVHIDIHTGVGEFKVQSIVGNHDEDIPMLRKQFGLVSDRPYQGHVLMKGPVEGSIQEGLPRLLKEVKRVNWLGFGLEYGTEDWVRRFLVLRRENFQHFSNSEFEQFVNLEDEEDRKLAKEYVADPAKRKLLRTYNPEDLGWQRAVLRQARVVVKKAVLLLADIPRERL